MPIAQTLYDELIHLQSALRDARLPSDNLPPRNAFSRVFAFWFALQALQLMQYRDELHAQEREAAIPERVVSGLGRVAAALRAVLGLPVPEPRNSTSLATASSYLSFFGSTINGDNWCRHADGSEIPMLIHRNMDPRAPELEMTCSEGHLTRYDDGSGTTPMLKV